MGGLPPTNCSSAREGAAVDADPAFILFGKQISTGLLTPKIKEEFSPTGVDESGLSLSTSSDEDEDLNDCAVAATAACEVAMVREKLTNNHEDQYMISSAQTAKEQLMSQQSFEQERRRILHMQWPKAHDSHCPPQLRLTAKQEPEKQHLPNDQVMCLEEGMEVEKHAISERELNMEEDPQAAKRQGGLWSQCPRCSSTDTKFCYFNNYNVNQPRHFCKHCQRYWTAGGTLRNVPVGAGKRKNKHALRKEAFFMSPLCGSNKMASLHASEDGTESNHTAKSDSVDVINVDVLADGGPIWDSDLAFRQGPSPMVNMASVNTDLNLCGHQKTSTSSTQHQLTSLNTLPSHKPHSLTTLQQLQMGLPSPFCPTLASGSSNSNQAYSNLACMRSTDRPICPSDASGVRQIVPGSCSRISQICPDGRSNFSQFCPQLASGSGELCQISRSGSSGSIQISPHSRSESSGGTQASGYLQSGSSELRQTGQDDQLSSANLQESGFAKRPPDLAKWPYFYNVWLDSVASLGLKPILTPQGWAFPFVPPSSSTATQYHPTASLQKAESSTSSTQAIRSPRIASIPSCGKRFADVMKSGQYDDGYHKSYKCSKVSTE